MVSAVFFKKKIINTTKLLNISLGINRIEYNMIYVGIFDSILIIMCELD